MGLKYKGPDPIESHIRNTMNHIPHPLNHIHLEGVRIVVGSGWKEMGDLPRGNHYLRWLF